MWIAEELVWKNAIAVRIIIIAIFLIFAATPHGACVPTPAWEPVLALPAPALPGRVQEQVLVYPVGSIAIASPANNLSCALVVDTGATSGCMASNHSYLIESITDHNPNSTVKVGDAVKLRVLQIATVVIPNIPGFKIVGDTPRSESTHMRLKRFLIVDGLDPEIIILSVRKMKEIDGIRIFLDVDNSFGVDDCLRLPDATFVPFGTRNQAYEIYPGLPSSDVASYSLLTPARDRLRVHASLCHAGRTRVAMSEITFHGRKPPLLQQPHDCRGCRAAAPRPPDSKGRGGGRRQTLVNAGECMRALGACKRS